jgi:hypothetical protein
MFDEADSALSWAKTQLPIAEDHETRAAAAKANAPQRVRDVFDEMHGITK